MPSKKKRSKRAGATRNKEQSSFSFSTIVIVVLVASFVGFLVYLDKIPTAENQQAGSKEQKEPKNEPKKPKHQFDFYTVLPDREVKVVDTRKEQSRKNTTPIVVSQANVQPKQVTQPVASKKELPKLEPGAVALYQLQVGAFSELSKADAMKARLAFLGVQSNIQVIQNKGNKMYRVRVGPSTDSKKINQIKSQLKAQNINTFVQKIRG